MSNPVYAAVDWGTSSFRLWLLDASGNALAESRGSDGMTQAATKGFEPVLEAHLHKVEAPADLPVMACGMVGARQGWIEAGYVDVPASLSTILSGAVRVATVRRDVRILPGLAQRDEARPDVIRGEETQLLGALDEAADIEAVCMPGTHSKWVHLAGGTVASFSTFMTGELFDAISKHTILAHAVASGEGAPAFDAHSFRQAVSAAFTNPAHATNQLFTARSGQLLHNLSPAGSSARISGTLIGLELAGALSGGPASVKVGLVASGRLLDLYETAFETLSLTYQTIDADTAVRKGLFAAAKSIWA